MHGRSLVRTLDASAFVITAIAVGTLLLIAWTTRLIDQRALSTEVTILRQQLNQFASSFDEQAPASLASVPRWSAAQAQVRGVFHAGPSGRFVQAEDGSRIAGLMADNATAARLEDTLASLKRLNPNESRIEFVRIGPSGDDHLALVKLLGDGASADRLLVSLIDFAVLAKELEAFGLELKPVAARADALGAIDGRLAVDGIAGEPVAYLGWQSNRVSQTIRAFVLPILAVGLAAGLCGLMLLRRYWSQARDGFMSELKVVEALAHTDPLTGLPNRRALFEHLKTVTGHAQAGVPATILMLDLDGFKTVNDQHGHQFGDRVLKQAAEVFRTECGPRALLARLGGDEFVAVLPEALDEPAVFRLHQQLQAALRSRVPVDGAMPIGLSIGAVTSAAADTDGEGLLKLADLAVYSAKLAGRGLAMVYHPDMQSQIAYRRMLERELRHAILTEALFLAYQPIVDSLSARVLGYEALVRWKHPTRGIIPPGDFIPIAERSDLIVGLGNFVLERALAEMGPRGDFRISVNATGRQLLAPGFVDLVLDLLKRYHVAPSRLCLELTETAIVSDPDSLAVVMETLKRHGIRFAIDDFGAGYSSLNHLLRFKFDVLKIDRDFIAGLDAKPEAPMIVTAVVSLARSLGMQVVGEGIETPAQQRFLASAGCGALQGYLFGRPLPLAALDTQHTLAEPGKATTLEINEQVA